MDSENFTNVFCVETGKGKDSVPNNMDEQMQIGANYIAGIWNNPKYTTLEDDGIFFIGLSQGGIIAQVIFSNIPMISKQVRRSLTLTVPFVRSTAI